MSKTHTSYEIIFLNGLFWKCVFIDDGYCLNTNLKHTGKFIEPYCGNIDQRIYCEKCNAHFEIMTPEERIKHGLKYKSENMEKCY